MPLTVVRLCGDNIQSLSELGEKILNHWRNYSDENVGVYAFSGNTPHNTITPIARRRGEKFELDLVLRTEQVMNIQMEYSIHTKNFIILKKKI